MKNQLEGKKAFDSHARKTGEPVEHGNRISKCLYDCVIIAAVAHLFFIVLFHFK